MNAERRSKWNWISLIGFATVLPAAVFAVVCGVRWMNARRGGDGVSSGDATHGTEASLPDGEAQQIRDLVKAMMNPDRSAEAVAELRSHIDARVQEKSASAPLTMTLFVECLEPKFASLDTETRTVNVLFLADILGWFGENPTNCWTALLGPCKTVLSSALADSSTDVSLAALRIVRDCWEWSPPNVGGAAQKKALGTWKSELHERCAELLASRDAQVRLAAGLAVVSVPLDLAAAKGLVLLEDKSPEVRRNILLALSERPEVLSNDDVLAFLNDPKKRVRDTADIVLSSRGLSREQIALASRATHASPQVRAQVPRQIVESSAVDRGVWLSHLSRDESAQVRIEAARALAAIGDDDGKERLAEMAQNDPDTQVRGVASELLRPKSPPESKKVTATPSARSARSAAKAN